MQSDITNIVLLVTFLVIFGVFLCFDLFERNEKYGYFAYIIVVLPVNFLWYLTSLENSVFSEINSLAVFLILFILIDICLARDLIFVYRENKDFDDIILFLLLGLILQIVITGILPHSVDALKNDTAELWVFYLPDVHNPNFAPGLRVGFQVAATMMVLLAIAPMILDIKDEEIPLPVIVVITIIFYAPFLYLGYVWLGEAGFVVAFLLCVLLFIALLVITKS
ncbi:MAG: hypothetical protein ACFFAS_00055 [Promethearchaeota archaeon]